MSNYTKTEIFDALVKTILTSKEIDEELKPLKVELAKIDGSTPEGKAKQFEFLKKQFKEGFGQYHLGTNTGFSISKNIDDLYVEAMFRDLAHHQPILTKNLILQKEFRESIQDPRCLIGPSMRNDNALFRLLLELPGVKKGVTSREGDFNYSMNMILKRVKENGQTEIHQMLLQARNPSSFERKAHKTTTPSFTETGKHRQQAKSSVKTAQAPNEPSKSKAPTQETKLTFGHHRKGR